MSGAKTLAEDETSEPATGSHDDDREHAREQAVDPLQGIGDEMDRTAAGMASARVLGQVLANSEHDALAP